MVLLYCGVFSQWVGLDWWLVKISWLGELVSLFWWMGLDLFFLEYNEVSSNEFWGVYGFGMALGNLSFNAQGLFLLCWRISMVCLALQLVGSWIGLYFSVDMEIFR